MKCSVLQGVNDYRPWRRLQPNHVCHTPADHVFIAAKARREEHNGRADEHLLTLHSWLGCKVRIERQVLTRANVAGGTQAGEFWDWLLTAVGESRCTWVWAEFASRDFILLGLLEAMNQGQLLLLQHHSVPGGEGKPPRTRKWQGFAIVEDPPFIVRVQLTGTKKTLCFASTANYFRGEHGVPCGDGSEVTVSGEFIASVGVDAARQLKDSVNSCKNKVMQAIDFVRTHDSGNWAYTLPGQAWNSFRHRSPERAKLILTHGRKAVHSLERDAYYGGMCQAFYKGNIVRHPGRRVRKKDPKTGQPITYGPIHVYDAVSFYPSIMAVNEFPYELIHHKVSPTWAELLHVRKDYAVVAFVDLECDPPGFPIRRNRRFFYGAGKVSTVLCGPELDRAISEVAIRRVREMAVFRKAVLFDQWVSIYRKVREAYKASSDDIMASYSKLFLNSLYGKFGQQTPDWEDNPDQLCHRPFTSWFVYNTEDESCESWRSIGNMAQKLVAKSEWKWSFPSISAFVTSYGREVMLSWIAVAGQGNVYYCDTDSLHVNAEGNRRLLSASGVVGGDNVSLELRGTYQSGRYLAEKSYELDGNLVAAGMKSNSTLNGRHQYVQQCIQSVRSVITGAELDTLIESRRHFNLPDPGDQPHRSRLPAFGFRQCDDW